MKKGAQGSRIRAARCSSRAAHFAALKPGARLSEPCAMQWRAAHPAGAPAVWGVNASEKQ